MKETFTNTRTRILTCTRMQDTHFFRSHISVLSAPLPFLIINLDPPVTNGGSASPTRSSGTHSSFSNSCRVGLVASLTLTQSRAGFNCTYIRWPLTNCKATHSPLQFSDSFFFTRFRTEKNILSFWCIKKKKYLAPPPP